MAVQGVALVPLVFVVVAATGCCLAASSAIAMDRIPIRTISPADDVSPVKADLGRRLFTDRRFSDAGDVACVDCHDPMQGGADGRPTFRGTGGAVGDVNTPTVYNAAYNLAQGWIGRAETLRDQIDDHLADPRVFGTDWDALLDRLGGDPAIDGAFVAAYGNGPTRATATDALETYLRSLVTTGSPFDRFLGGDPTAISEDARAGYALFRAYGCAACHQGANLGGNLYQVLGVIRDYFADRSHDPAPADLGRYDMTGDARDRHLFRVPGLRRAASTAPYFHDGSIATLEEAIQVMAVYQLGRHLDGDQIRQIAAFLRSLEPD